MLSVRSHAAHCCKAVAQHWVSAPWGGAGCERPVGRHGGPTAGEQTTDEGQTQSHGGHFVLDDEQQVAERAAAVMQKIWDEAQAWFDPTTA